MIRKIFKFFLWVFLFLVIIFGLFVAMIVGSVSIYEHFREPIEKYIAEDTDTSENTEQNISEPKETEESSTKEEDSTEKYDGSVDNMEDLASYIESSLKKGKKLVKINVWSISDKDMKEINEYLPNYYGYVDTYSYIENEDHSYSYEFNTVLNDQYYVEDYFLHNTPIPDEEFAAKKIAEKCEKILDELSLDSDTNYRKEKKIHDYLVNHISYDNEKGKDCTSIYSALIKKKSVCEGYAKSMKLLCDISGVPCEIIHGYGDKDLHMWNLVKLNNHWYHVDCTWDDQKSRGDNDIYPYFNVSDEYNLGHTWGREAYPVCDSMEFNYYVINDTFCHDAQDVYDLCTRRVQNGEDSVQCFGVGVKKSDLSNSKMKFLFDKSSSLRKYTYESFDIHGNKIIIFRFFY